MSGLRLSQTSDPSLRIVGNTSHDLLVTTCASSIQTLSTPSYDLDRFDRVLRQAGKQKQ